MKIVVPAWVWGVPEKRGGVNCAPSSSNKFNEHFERRKNKPSDQNYNINERIYDEITTKLYFNFLCQFIVSLPP